MKEVNERHPGNPLLVERDRQRMLAEEAAAQPDQNGQKPIDEDQTVPVVDRPNVVGGVDLDRFDPDKIDTSLGAYTCPECGTLDGIGCRSCFHTQFGSDNPLTPGPDALKKV